MSYIQSIIRISDFGGKKIDRKCDICNRNVNLSYMGHDNEKIIFFCVSCYMDLPGSKCSCCGKPIIFFPDGQYGSGLCSDCKGVGKRVLEKFK